MDFFCRAVPLELSPTSSNCQRGPELSHNPDLITGGIGSTASWPWLCWIPALCPPLLQEQAMAGRGGRGRGRSQMTFNVEAVGIGKGDSLPPSTLQPSPLFPPMEYKPVPLQTGEEVEYMLALKQELRGAMKNLPYYVKPAAPKKDVERYSDKYQMSGPIDNAIDWNPDWRRLPRELKIRVRKLRKERTTILIPKHKQRLPVDKEEAIKKLETLEKKEEEVTSEEEGEKEEEEEGKEEEEEEYDEEEHEEETDYIMSYFDNGEEFGADSDDNMDEAIY
ncbi:DNA-directed RNA polymerase III subunit RPC7-like isoform X1 [Chelonia mydas]|uniref:DNA-directed RNA polymerase III subunit RPC7-like isoform X1 n=1 Tax=Chelonia mydas TaxID=8469 RepID=UPI0018A1C637|nr:DNA-directed RNA polymerase III subunit RPC7-like isoform X1 [Chelonia mydas]